VSYLNLKSIDEIKYLPLQANSAISIIVENKSKNIVLSEKLG
jgi:hypothetical protein